VIETQLKLQKSRSFASSGTASAWMNLDEQPSTT
jgi:hypothetical protein